MENDSIVAAADHILNAEGKSVLLLPLVSIVTLALVYTVSFFSSDSSGAPGLFKKSLYATALVGPSVAFLVMIWEPQMHKEASCRTVVTGFLGAEEVSQPNLVADAFSTCLQTGVIADTASEVCPKMADRLLQSPSARLVGGYRQLCGQDTLDAVLLRQKG